MRELSQLNDQLRAWSGIGTPGWEARAGIDFMPPRAQGEEGRSELRGRGVEPAEGSVDQPVPAQGANPSEDRRAESPGVEADAAALLAEKVCHLERALFTRTVIGEAKGILIWPVCHRQLTQSPVSHWVATRAAA
jgi:hypothetical protein